MKVYYASEEYGLDNVNVSGGYYLMANIFFKIGKSQVADSLYRQVCVIFFFRFCNIYSFVYLLKVTEIWCDYLINVVKEKTKISALDSILGKKDDEAELDILGEYSFLKTPFC